MISRGAKGKINGMGGAMQGGHTKLFTRSLHTKRAILAVVLVTLAGCVTGGKVRTESADKQAAAGPALAEGSSVARLQDGREGFIIQEPSSTDAELHGDFNRAGIMIKDGDYQGAISLLEKVIERAPDITAPYINAAIAYMHTGKADKAEQHLKTALGLVAGHPVASNEYGLLLRKAGRFAEARAVYEKALSIFPDYHPVHRNLGILCDLYMNDLACALEHYEIYSVAVPKDEQAKLWIADLRVRLGR